MFISKLHNNQFKFIGKEPVTYENSTDIKPVTLSKVFNDKPSKFQQTLRSIRKVEGIIPEIEIEKEDKEKLNFDSFSSMGLINLYEEVKKADEFGYLEYVYLRDIPLGSANIELIAALKKYEAEFGLKPKRRMGEYLKRKVEGIIPEIEIEKEDKEKLNFDSFSSMGLINLYEEVKKADEFGYLEYVYHRDIPLGSANIELIAALKKYEAEFGLKPKRRMGEYLKK
jgi:acyl carrier protein